MPPVGSFVSFKAHLSPPLAPLRPGGYDFARDMYFQGSAPPATRWARSRVDAAAGRGFWLGFAAFLANLRDIIDARMRAVIPGDPALSPRL